MGTAAVLLARIVQPRNLSADTVLVAHTVLVEHTVVNHAVLVTGRGAREHCFVRHVARVESWPADCVDRLRDHLMGQRADFADRDLDDLDS